MTIEIDPTQDGVDHINVYSGGNTLLGKRLSNMHAISFIHPEHGEFGCLEGFWWFLATGMKDISYRTMYGLEARVKGKKEEKVHLDDFAQRFIEAIYLRLKQNPGLLAEVKANKLPYKHYYNYGGKILDHTARHQWQLDVYEQVSHPVELRILMSGSRHYDQYNVFKQVTLDYIRQFITPFHSNSDVTLITGLARTGADDMTIRLCREMGFNMEGYAPDWNLHGKAAGMIRNTTMSKKCNKGLFFWDGESRGTKHMIDTLVKNGIEHLVYLTTKGL